MKEVILLLSMLFCHIVDDYYLQGWLASAKQKTWWEKNCSDKLNSKDYLMALAEHAFSWCFIIHLPVIICILSGVYSVNVMAFCILFAVNWVVHAQTDNLKANKKSINLIQDQLIHVVQIVSTWIAYCFVF